MSEDRSDDAYTESSHRHESKRAAVLRYLIERAGQWVPGPELREPGGTEATRRVRELRKYLAARGTHDIECDCIEGVWSYRLVRLEAAA